MTFKFNPGDILVRSKLFFEECSWEKPKYYKKVEYRVTSYAGGHYYRISRYEEGKFLSRGEYHIENVNKYFQLKVVKELAEDGEYYV